MKLNKIFFLAGIVAAGVFASCSDDDYKAAAPVKGNQLQAVTFGDNNIQEAEVDPSENSYTVTIYRDSEKSEEAASVPLKVITNEGGVFTVPATAEFEAGSAEAEVVITFDEAEVGDAYELEFAIDDAFVNPYTSKNSFALTLTKVKWNSLGTGLWFDGWFGDLFEVEIFQRDDKPLEYRFTNPLDDDYVSEFIPYGYEPGTYTNYISLTTTKTDGVKWDHFLFNTIYTGYGEMWAVYDADNAANNFVVRNENGGIQYFQVNPNYYLPDIDYDFGNNDICYLIFPGQDLPEALQEGDEE